MPIRVADLAKERKEIIAATSLGGVLVVYRPNVRTPADEARMIGLTGEEAYREMLQSMKKLIASWELVGPVYDAIDGSVVVEEDAPVPIEPEVLQHMPSSLLTLIYQDIIEDMRPNSQKNPSNASPKRLFTGSMS